MPLPGPSTQNWKRSGAGRDAATSRARRSRSHDDDQPCRYRPATSRRADGLSWDHPVPSNPKVSPAPQSSPGQDPPRRVWPVRGDEPSPARGGQAGDFRLPGLHALLRDDPETTLSTWSQTGRQTGQQDPDAHRRSAPQALAPRHLGGRKVARAGLRGGCAAMRIPTATAGGPSNGDPYRDQRGRRRGPPGGDGQGSSDASGKAAVTPPSSPCRVTCCATAANRLRSRAASPPLPRRELPAL